MLSEAFDHVHSHLYIYLECVGTVIGSHYFSQPEGQLLVELHVCVSNVLYSTIVLLM